jgi:hypothetical protein
LWDFPTSLRPRERGLRQLDRRKRKSCDASSVPRGTDGFEPSGDRGWRIACGREFVGGVS